MKIGTKNYITLDKIACNVRCRFYDLKLNIKRFNGNIFLNVKMDK